MLTCDDFVTDYFRTEETSLLIWRDRALRSRRDTNHSAFLVRNRHISDYYIAVIFLKVFFIIIIIRALKISRFFFLIIIYLNLFMLKFTKTYDDEDATIFMIQWRRKQTKSEGGEGVRLFRNLDNLKKPNYFRQSSKS